LVPLLLALRNASPGAGFRQGFVFGLAHYLSLLHWIVHTIHTYGHLPVSLAVPLLFLLCCYLALFPAAAAWAACRFCRHPLGLAAGLPVLWAALEYLRTVLLSGFPWALLGYSQSGVLPVIQVADITGAYGVSYLVCLVNAALFLVLLHRSGKTWQGGGVSRRQRNRAAAAAAAAVVLAVSYGVWRLHEVGAASAAAPTALTGVVQGNIPQDRKWDPAFQIASTKTYIARSGSLREREPDLVVWPETATPFYLFDNDVLTRMVRRGIRATGSHFVIGSPAVEAEGRTPAYFNSAYVLDPEGQPVGRYDKAHLVPYGEYVPLRRFMPFVGKLVAQVGDFTPGEPGRVLPSPKAALGPLICYEVIFPALSRAMVRNGAGLLVNLTNDAWFGRTGAPYQHFSAAIFRAVENRRSLVRAANTGISGFVDPTGRVLEASPIFVEATLIQAVPVLGGRTPYTRFGDLFAMVCLAATAAVPIAHRLRGASKPG
jgi:apolipoprotein N-acyltransferase